MINVETVRVFTTEDGRHGNPLGIVDGAAVPEADRQAVARRLGFSETVFVDDPDDGRIAIFTPAVELPFAGHPTVGAAWWLAQGGHRPRALQVPAGEVAITLDGPTTRVRGRADWAPEFTITHLATVDDVLRADPGAVRSGQHYLWAWADERAGSVRSRMFAPAMGIVEDEATGAAAIRLTALLRRDLDITQGIGSRIGTTWEDAGWVGLGGRVVAGESRALA